MRFVQLENTRDPISFTLAGISIDSKLEFSNALRAILCILSGNIMCFSAVQDEQRYAEIFVKFLGNTTFCKAVQSEKHHKPILVTESGIIIETMFLLLNALEGLSG